MSAPEPAEPGKLTRRQRRAAKRRAAREVKAVSAADTLAKRTAGEPLSEAEHQQRVEAGKASAEKRRTIAAGAVAGAAAGAIASGIASEVKTRRVKAMWAGAVDRSRERWSAREIAARQQRAEAGAKARQARDELVAMRLKQHPAWGQASAERWADALRHDAAASAPGGSPVAAGASADDNYRALEAAYRAKAQAALEASGEWATLDAIERDAAIRPMGAQRARLRDKAKKMAREARERASPPPAAAPRGGPAPAAPGFDYFAGGKTHTSREAAIEAAKAHAAKMGQPSWIGVEGRQGFGRLGAVAADGTMTLPPEGVPDWLDAKPKAPKRPATNSAPGKAPAGPSPEALAAVSRWRNADAVRGLAEAREAVAERNAGVYPAKAAARAAGIQTTTGAGVRRFLSTNRLRHIPAGRLGRAAALGAGVGGALGLGGAWVLGKRTPGAPLSDAEVRQRREAAAARWAGHVAAGAAAGAAAEGLRQFGGRAVARLRAARQLQAGNAAAQAVDEAAEAKEASIRRGANVKRGKANAAWPTKTYAQHLGRQIAQRDEQARRIDVGERVDMDRHPKLADAPVDAYLDHYASETADMRAVRERARWVQRPARVSVGEGARSGQKEAVVRGLKRWTDPLDVPEVRAEYDQRLQGLLDEGHNQADAEKLLRKEKQFRRRRSTLKIEARAAAGGKVGAYTRRGRMVWPTADMIGAWQDEMTQDIRQRERAASSWAWDRAYRARKAAKQAARTGARAILARMPRISGRGAGLAALGGATLGAGVAAWRGLEKRELSEAERKQRIAAAFARWKKHAGDGEAIVMRAERGPAEGERLVYTSGSPATLAQYSHQGRIGVYAARKAGVIPANDERADRVTRALYRLRTREIDQHGDLDRMYRTSRTGFLKTREGRGFALQDDPKHLPRILDRLGADALAAPEYGRSYNPNRRTVIFRDASRLRRLGEVDLSKAAAHFPDTRKMVAAAAAATATPTPAQAEAGNYRKGKVQLHGLTIAIETPAGAERRGMGRDGKPWSVKMPGHYGYVLGTLGADGDHVDVTLGPQAHEPGPVWVIDQVNDGGRFDEHKAFLGWGTREAAIGAYDASFSDGKGPQRRKAVTRLSWPDFVAWLRQGNTEKPLAKVDEAAPDDGSWRVEREEGSSSGATTPADIASRVSEVFRVWMRDPAKARDAEGIGAAVQPVGDLFRQAAASVKPPLPPSPPGRPGDDGGRNFLVVDFDSRNPRIEAWARRYELDRIRAITDETRESIRAAVIAGVQSGLPIPEQARMIREAIGLAPNQAVWVRNYREELEEGELGKAMARQLRDRRHDPVLLRHIDSGEPLPADQVQRMVDSYHRRTLAFRATTIARTEGLRAANLGQVAGTRAYLEQDDTLTVIKTWIATTSDDRTREAHQDLNGQEVVGLETPFVWRNPRTGQEQRIRYPHDPEADADQVIRCRCGVGFRLVPKPEAGRLRAVDPTKENPT